MITAIPRPQLGDKMFRNTLIGLREEAMVLSITSHKAGKSWTAVLMTKNGIEFIGSDNEHRGQFDWAPVSWEYDEKAWDIPEPLPGEKYMSWRSRVFREVPGLRKEAKATDILSTAWKNETAQPVSAK